MPIRVWRLSLLTAFWLLAACLPAGAEELATDLVAAQRALEVAELRQRRYEQLEYPLALRRLESAITLTKAEMAALEASLAEYEQFDKFTGSSPLFHTLQRTRLALVEARLRLDDLQEEKRLRMRLHGDQCRLHELEVEAARARLAALQAPIAQR